MTQCKNVTPGVTPGVTVRPLTEEEKEARYRLYKEGCLRDGVDYFGAHPERKYPAILEALVDPIRRAKMQAICESLAREIHGLDGRLVNLQSEVRYGFEGPTLDVVSKWLEVTA